MQDYVIGSTVEAFAYAYKHSLPVLFTRLEYPHEFDFCSPDDDFSSILIENNPIKLVSNNKEKTIIGASKIEVWERLYFLLSLAGLFPFGDLVRSISLNEEKKTIRLNIKNYKIKELSFDNLFIFSDEGLFGLPTPEVEDANNFKVIDWFKVHKGANHRFDLLESGDLLLNKVYFHAFKTRSKFYHKDAVGISFLGKEMLDEYEFSDINAKFKLIKMMKRAKINKSIKIEILEREVISLEKRKYENTKFLKFENNNKEICSLDTTSVYMLRLIHHFKLGLKIRK